MARTAVLVFVLLLTLQTTVGLKKYACESPVYCRGPLLEAVQTSDVFPDSKTFVDMSMKTDAETIIEDFEKLTDHSRQGLETFVREHFSGPGDELETWTPQDWSDKCEHLEAKLQDPHLRYWVGELNSLWKVLGRKMKDDVQEHQDRHSLLYVPKPFIIPGDRFREFYYWDSYWIMNGLLVCNMTTTSRGMLENFLHYVQTLGHIPNGGRIYYTRRSQPPFLTPMMDSYYKATSDLQFIRDNIHLMEKEYMFWVNNRSLSVRNPRSGLSHTVARYTVDMNTPRPEGYVEDVKVASHLPEEDRGRVYSDLAAGAESGWDFSSRWFDRTGPRQYTIEGIRTANTIPVDLNSYLFLSEKLLAHYYDLLDNTEKRDTFLKYAKARELAIYDLFWNSTQGSWFDLDLGTLKHRVGFYPSNLAPMFAGCYGNVLGESKQQMVERVLLYLKNEHILSYVGGIPTSKVPTSQQWDGENAWAPNIHMVVEGLASSGSRQAQRMALQLARKWIQNNFITYQNYHAMFEKYDAERVGVPGGGGEYTVQVGFGWTNGVALMLLDRYGDALVTNAVDDYDIVHSGGDQFTTTTIMAIVICGVVVIGFAALVVACAINYTTKRKTENARKLEFQNVPYVKVPAYSPARVS